MPWPERSVDQLLGRQPTLSGGFEDVPRRLRNAPLCRRGSTGLLKRASARTEAEKQLLSPDQHRLLALLPQLAQDSESQVWVVSRAPATVEGSSQPLLLVPQALRRKVVEAAHQFLGHAGRTATYEFCKQRVFMIRLMPEVSRTLQGCQLCQL